MKYLNIGTIILSIIAVSISLYTMLEQRRASMTIANIEFLNDQLSMLKSNPRLLAIHGITEEDLQKNDVTAEELIYMLNSVYSAQAFYYVGNYHTKKLSSYRLHILKNKKFERAWKNLIRNRMTSRTPFTDLLDDYYAGKYKG